MDGWYILAIFYWSKIKVNQFVNQKCLNVIAYDVTQPLIFIHFRQKIHAPKNLNIQFLELLKTQRWMLTHISSGNIAKFVCFLSINYYTQCVCRDVTIIIDPIFVWLGVSCVLKWAQISLLWFEKWPATLCPFSSPSYTVVIEFVHFRNVAGSALANRLLTDHFYWAVMRKINESTTKNLWSENAIYSRNVTGFRSFCLNFPVCLDFYLK